jgi:hypothetical protein
MVQATSMGSISPAHLGRRRIAEAAPAIQWTDVMMTGNGNTGGINEQEIN